MKLSHKLNARSATPLWLFALGLILSLTGAGVWWRAMASTSAQSFAVTAVLLGVIAVVYAAHEIFQRRR
jgi:membrane protein YdbS with pleckstrin-like domain